MYVVRYTWKELITEFFIYCTDVIQIGLQIYHANRNRKYVWDSIAY